MNRKIDSTMKHIPVCSVLLAACTINLALSPLAVSAANVNPTGSVTEWGYTMGSSRPTTVPLPSGVLALDIAAGQFHNLAITTDGLYTWERGVTTPMKVAFPPAVGTVMAAAGGMYHSLALTDDGIYAW